MRGPSHERGALLPEEHLREVLEKEAIGHDAVLLRSGAVRKLACAVQVSAGQAAWAGRNSGRCETRFQPKAAISTTRSFFGAVTRTMEKSGPTEKHDPRKTPARVIPG